MIELTYKDKMEMDKLPLVTCITPTYGRFPYLCEMVWCWMQQTYPRKELIIVNDQKNLKITCAIPNVKVFNFNDRFEGLGAKRNFAIAQASPESEFICPFDDDDLFFPEHIDFLVRAFDSPLLDRTKNRRHFVSIDNSFFHVNEDADQTFFGASLFRKQIFIDRPFQDYLVMGEDAELFENKPMNMKIETNPLISSFIHRRGMGIPHASGVIRFSREKGQQSSISQEFYMRTNQLKEEVTIEIIPKLIAGKEIYQSIDRHRHNVRNGDK